MMPFFCQIQPDDNDGVILSHYLKTCSNDQDICNLISSLEGCFAFIYFQVRKIYIYNKSSYCLNTRAFCLVQKKTKSLYYGRDQLGRRSLMYSISNDSKSNLKMIMSSVRLHHLVRYFLLCICNYLILISIFLVLHRT